MNREWAELNKTMQLQIKKKDTFAMFQVSSSVVLID